MSTTEGLAGMIAELSIDVQKGFEVMQTGFEVIASRFDRVDSDLEEMKRTLDRIDTRLAALELAVFGATGSRGGRISDSSIVERLSKLEATVFKK